MCAIDYDKALDTKKHNMQLSIIRLY